MVVISAALITKTGKVLIARQFIEITRTRIEGLLNAFPKLVTSENRQHTFIDTPSVRYVYQPLETFYILVITNKTSNIMEDLQTLQLLSKIIPDICGSIQETHIKEKKFELIFAIDEILTWGGHRENLNLHQIRTNLEMESNEEKVHNMILQSKKEAAKDEMKRQQRRIKEEQREKLRTERATNLHNEFLMKTSMSSSSSSSFSPPPSTMDYGQSSISTSGTPAAAPAKGSGMKLGGSKKGSNFVDAMVAEDDLKDLPPPPPPTGGSASSASKKPEPSVAVQNDPIGITIEEKISAQLNREGAIEQLEVKGSFYLVANDPNSAICRVSVDSIPTNGISVQTHPKIDKKLFEQQSIISLKDDSKPFPSSRVGVLRWGVKTQDESMLPINVTCWPEEDGGKISVNLEYFMEKNMVLEDVDIIIPLGATDAPPHVGNIDGTYRYNASEGRLIWHLDTIDSTNSSGTLEFTIRGNSVDVFFPISINFYSRNLYCDFNVKSVTTIADQKPIKYGMEKILSTENYFIQ